MWYQQRLWVDKHAPSFVSHLLSDERTNREVLRALRAWDPYVFERDAPARPVSAYHSGYNGGEGRNDNNKNSDGRRDASQNSNGGVNVRPDESSERLMQSLEKYNNQMGWLRRLGGEQCGRRRERSGRHYREGRGLRRSQHNRPAATIP